MPGFWLQMGNARGQVNGKTFPADSEDHATRRCVARDEPGLLRVRVRRWVDGNDSAVGEGIGMGGVASGSGQGGAPGRGSRLVSHDT
jgi:hypothetical protein